MSPLTHEPLIDALAPAAFTTFDLRETGAVQLVGVVIVARTGKPPEGLQLAPMAAIDLVVVSVALIAVISIGFATAKAPKSKKIASAPMSPPVNPPFRSADPNNPYASPQGDERDRLLDEM